MKSISECFLLFLCLSALARSQNTQSAATRFAGCYEVGTLSWLPADQMITLIPSRFQLSTNEIRQGQNTFEIQTLEDRSDRKIKESFYWTPKGDRFRVDFGNGLGGFSGTLKPTKNGEYVGALKERCDSRCEWKKHTGTMTIHKIECPRDAAQHENDNEKRKKTIVHMMVDDSPAPMVVSQPSGTTPKRIRISEGVADQLLIHRVPPAYPETARAAGIKGEVVLRVVIGQNGAVQNVQAISGDPALVSAAVDAVKQWQYKRYSLNGSPVEVETTATLNFTTNN